ncbi:RNase H domain-containing protein [Trichonephila clavipes]|nr:RNase H domain-containing protein [Trichonephila clavipes]
MLDYRTSNTKLWKLAKQIDNLKTSNEETNAIISDNGHVPVEAREAAEGLAQHYANESRLDFSSYDKHFARVTRNQVKSCRDLPADNPLFNVYFTLPELSYALQNLDTVKSPGPDSIPGHFLFHLGIRERRLYVCNLSWKTGKLPRQWKSAIVIPIHKPNKNAGLTTSYRPISLPYITCKLMECMVLRRLTHYLHTNNLMPSEQFALHGSRSDTGRAGSGIFSRTPGSDVKISIRNPDHCSVFRSEFIAIRGALDHALNSYNDSMWILTDSRSSIQYLKNWPKIMDSTGLDILSKLVRLGQRKQVCLQWIPSHVGGPGSEAADELAGRGCDLPNPSSTVFTHTKIHSFLRN